jgi:uncharacterized protein YcbK (DUF882 family)
MWNYRHFKSSEFDCKCEDCKDKNTGELKMDTGFMEKLEYARINSNVKYNINSGYRCRKHNKNVGGSKSSYHCQGKAADILYKSKSFCQKIMFGLQMAGFKRYQIYQDKTGSGWIHVDTGIKKPSLWLSIKQI